MTFMIVFLGTFICSVMKVGPQQHILVKQNSHYVYCISCHDVGEDDDDDAANDDADDEEDYDDDSDDDDANDDTDDGEDYDDDDDDDERRCCNDADCSPRMGRPFRSVDCS